MRLTDHDSRAGAGYSFAASHNCTKARVILNSGATQASKSQAMTLRRVQHVITTDFVLVIPFEFDPDEADQLTRALGHETQPHRRRSAVR